METVAAVGTSAGAPADAMWLGAGGSDGGDAEESSVGSCEREQATCRDMSTQRRGVAQRRIQGVAEGTPNYLTKPR